MVSGAIFMKHSQGLLVSRINSPILFLKLNKKQLIREGSLRILKSLGAGNQICNLDESAFFRPT